MNEQSPLVEIAPSRKPWFTQFKVWAVIGAFVLIGLAIMVPLAVLYGRSGTLVAAVNVDSVMSHLRQLQNIAQHSGGSRSVLSPGFNASVEYVMQALVAAGYDAVRQPFVFPLFQAAEAPRLAVADVSVPAGHFNNLRFSGSADVTSRLWFSGTGCTAAEYPPSFVAGNVALVLDSSGCTLQQRLAVAVSKGAAALVVGLGSDNTLSSPQLTGPDFAPIPMLVLSSFFTDAIKSGSNGAVATIHTRNTITPAYGSNVLANSSTGDINSVVVIGAHLDSVLAGPGINDNGSGAAVVLTIALELKRLGLNPQNQIRFAFFGAEEHGLVGSTYYVNSLEGDEKYRLAMMINFDMLGSPNYFMGVYNGSSASPGSTVIQRSFEQFAASRNYPTEPTPFTGRSDYGPFLTLRDGFPAGGLFSGAEVIKNKAQRAAYGGMQNVAFDPCYHQACDTVENINVQGLDMMSQMAAYSVSHFGFISNLRPILSKGANR